MCRAVLVCASLLAGCSGGDGLPSGPSGGSISITLSAPSMTLNQGASGTVTVTATRSGGFNGGVTITVQNAPTGVTASPSTTTIETASSTATLTIQAAASAAAGSSTLTIRASGSGVSDATATLTLVVAAVQAGSFTLSLEPPAATVNQGSSGQFTVNIARSASFTGTVALSATGLPSGVTASFDPSSASGTSSTLTLTAATGAATGTNTIIVRGTGPGVAEQTATLSLTVAASSGGSGTWRVCSFESILWFAFQDGAGPWTRVAAVNDAYTFDFSAGRGGVAYVEADGGGGFNTTVFFGTVDELNAQGTTRCEFANLGTRTVNGTVAGVPANEQAWIALGGSFALALPAVSTAFTLMRVADAPVDLMAARVEQVIAGTSVTNTPRKLILRRSLNPASGSTLPVLDFGSAEAFDPVARTITVTNLSGDVAFPSTWYHTTNGFVNNFFALGTGVSTTTLPWYGIPPDRQQATDLHALAVSAVPADLSPTTTRTAVQYFRLAEDRTVALGPHLSAPMVTITATSPYVRPRMELPVQPEYNRIWSMSYSQGASGQTRTIVMQLTSGYTGSVATVDVVVPDFEGTADWNSNWGLRPQTQIQWSAAATRWTAAGSGVDAPILEGSVVINASRSGQITP